MRLSTGGQNRDLLYRILQDLSIRIPDAGECLQGVIYEHMQE